MMNLQTQTISLTTLELAILTHYLVDDSLPLGQTALDDLGVDREQLDQVQEQLEEDGLLVYTPEDEKPGVAGGIALLLESALFPDQLCVLRILDKQNEVDSQIVFSFADDLIVCNYLGADGQHVFYELQDLDAVAWEMLKTLRGESDQAEIDHVSQPLAAILAQTQVLATLMVVDDPAQLKTAVESLSWLQTKNGLWLVDKASSTIEQALPVSHNLLQQRILTALQRF